uniref:ANK_REP_REGION domain-containing protein n=1 Tax=Macrostomum lignano TaxID=282301 RepID=A0A1I8F426_9PLAT
MAAQRGNPEHAKRHWQLAKASLLEWRSAKVAVNLGRRHLAVLKRVSHAGNELLNRLLATTLNIRGSVVVTRICSTQQQQQHEAKVLTSVYDSERAWHVAFAMLSELALAHAACDTSTAETKPAVPRNSRFIGPKLQALECEQPLHANGIKRLLRLAKLVLKSSELLNRLVSAGESRGCQVSSGRDFGAQICQLWLLSAVQDWARHLSRLDRGADGSPATIEARSAGLATRQGRLGLGGLGGLAACSFSSLRHGCLHRLEQTPETGRRLRHMRILRTAKPLSPFQRRRSAPTFHSACRIGSQPVPLPACAVTSAIDIGMLARSARGRRPRRGTWEAALPLLLARVALTGPRLGCRRKRRRRCELFVDADSDIVIVQTG